MDKSRGEVPKALVGPFGIVEGSISADLILGRILIRITSPNVDFFLFGSTEKSLRKGVVGGSSYPGKACIGPHEGEELFRYPGGVGRAPVCPQFRQYACVRYALAFQSHGIEVLHMGGIDRRVDFVPDDKPGEEIDEDDEVPADMVDEQFCPVLSPT